MKKSVTEQRQIQNEAVFRKMNERTTESLKQFNQMARENDQLDLVNSEDTDLHFYCECSDENCHERVVLSSNEYETVHADRKKFVLKPGHQAVAIETVVARKNGYSVVKKHKQPPEQVGQLQQTS